MRNLKSAPKDPDKVISGKDLAEALKPLVGKKFELTDKIRTNGSNLRKMITDSLVDKVESTADAKEYTIIPPKGKGVPKMLSLLIDSFIVTTGENYNLQVWNRDPNGKSPLVVYNNGKKISPKDIRLVFGKIETDNNKIESFVTLTPQYIVDNFGDFGKPTVKSQLLISSQKRQDILEKNGIAFYPDTDKVSKSCSEIYSVPTNAFCDEPKLENLLSLETIKERVADQLMGQTLDGADTKTRGQNLERLVIEKLGYEHYDTLAGGYPDVPNQLLEVKDQESQTVDLGKYSPQFDTKTIFPGISTFDVRYLIALTNPNTHIIEGVILSSGKHLGDDFTYVSDKSFKCQRSIPMSFFEKYKGKSVFNP